MTVFVNDTFTDTDGVLLENHTPETGGAWVRRTGSREAEIQSNEVTRVGTGTSGKYINGAIPGNVEYDVMVDYRPPAGSLSFLYARFTDASNYYETYYQGSATKMFLRKRVVGVFTILDTKIEALAVDTLVVWKFEIRDAAKKVYFGGVEKLTSADDALTNAGGAGLVVAPDDEMDNFVADDVGGGPAIVEGSAILMGAGALAALALLRSLGTATLAGTGSIAASALAVAFGTAPLMGSGALSAAGLRSVNGSGALAGGGSLDADGLALVLAASAMVGAGSINADALAIVPASVAMPGLGGLSSAALAIVPTTAALVGAGTCGLTAPVAVIFGVATLTGTESLSANGDVAVLAIVLGAALLTASGGLRAAGISYLAPGTWGTWRQRATLWEMMRPSPRLPSDFRKDPDGTTPWDLP